MIRSVSLGLAAFLSMTAAHAADSLDSEMSGFAALRCDVKGVDNFAFSEALNDGDAKARSKTLSDEIVVQCNAQNGFDLTLTSLNGGLLHTEKPEGFGDYDGRITYQATVTQLTPIGSDGLNGVTFNETDKSFTGTYEPRYNMATLTVKTFGGQQILPLQGNYEDVLTVSITGDTGL